jgi:serine/threonine protein kinase
MPTMAVSDELARSTPTPAAERVGRYTIDRHLARGGMAEVFLGRAEGPGGFSKKVVIKRILPEFSHSVSFTQMFLDEARLAALLTHPNLVQVFDFGEDAGHYYLAMEYVEGATLWQVCEHFASKQLPVPLREVVQIVIGVCEGLQYAHGACGEDGVCYNIIHRDVSPDNIIISSTGVPKLLDFGIAKAEVLSSKTQAGEVKGKVSYLTPEQIRGEVATPQVDVYMLGATLFTALSGRRAYLSETDYGLYEAILNAPVPQLQDFRPEVGQELSKVVATAMAKNKEARYPDAATFQAALENWLVTTGPRVPQSAVAQMVRAALQAGSSLAKGATSRPARITPPPKPSEATVSTPPAASLPRLAPGFQIEEVLELGDAPGVPIGRRISRARKVLVALAASALLLGVALALKAGKRERAPPRDLVVKAIPHSDLGPREPLMPVQEAPPAPEVVSVPDAKAFVSPVPKATVKAVSNKVAGKIGYLTVRSDPWCDVFLDGKRLGETPISRVPVAIGSHVLELRNGQAGASRMTDVKVNPAEELRKVILFKKGLLLVEAKPGTRVTLNGVAVGEAPLAPLEVVQGTHHLKAQIPSGHTEHRTVRVEENGRVSVNVSGF